MTGDLWTAQEAAEIGLVNKVVPDDKLIDAGIELAIAHHYHTTSADAREGLRAFADGKRRPNFKGV